jgi:hypothetical protein
MSFLDEIENTNVAVAPAPKKSSFIDEIDTMPTPVSASKPKSFWDEIAAIVPTGQAATGLAGAGVVPTGTVLGPGDPAAPQRLAQRKAELAIDAERAQLPTVPDVGKGLLSGFSGALADTGQMMQQGQRLSSPLFLAGKAAKYIGEKTGNQDVVQRGAQLAAAGTIPQIIQDKLVQAAEKNGLPNTAAAVQTAGDLLSGKALMQQGEKDTKSLMDSMTRGGR